MAILKSPPMTQFPVLLLVVLSLQTLQGFLPGIHPQDYTTLSERLTKATRLQTAVPNPTRVPIQTRGEDCVGPSQANE